MTIFTIYLKQEQLFLVFYVYLSKKLCTTKLLFFA